MSVLAFFGVMALGLSIPVAYKLGVAVGSSKGCVMAAHRRAALPAWSEALTATDIDHQGLRLPAGTPGYSRPLDDGYELCLSFRVLPNDLLVVGREGL